MNNINIPENVDVAIIGGGMAGLSAAASLSQMGVKNVAVFESEKLAHCDGSSFGESRMYREMYSVRSFKWCSGSWMRFGWQYSRL